MQVSFKKLHENAKAPRYAKAGDAGMDLFAVDFTVNEGYVQYHTGIAMEIPEGYVGLLFPRSSNSKKDLLMCNSVGVIDSGYRGEVCARFKVVTNAGVIKTPSVYGEGEAVCQLIIMPYPQIEFEEVFELSDSERGTDGFGSTNTTEV